MKAPSDPNGNAAGAPPVTQTPVLSPKKELALHQHMADTLPINLPAPSLRMSRVWAMPNADTFDVPPIAGFVRKYLMRSKLSVDPFARNKRWATYTNDINPDTAAESHQDAEDFLLELAIRNIQADLLIFDPPYSPRQLKECYASFGRKMSARGWTNGSAESTLARRSSAASAAWCGGPILRMEQRGDGSQIRIQAGRDFAGVSRRGSQ